MPAVYQITDAGFHVELPAAPLTEEPSTASGAKWSSLSSISPSQPEKTSEHSPIALHDFMLAEAEAQLHCHGSVMVMHCSGINNAAAYGRVKAAGLCISSSHFLRGDCDVLSIVG